MKQPPLFNQMGERLMLTLNSNPRNVSKVETFVERILSRYNVSQDTYGNILISLTEAVTNAIRHGNNYDEQKKVRIKLSKSRHGLSFRVSDEGQGFNYSNLPDPTAPSNILNIGGRGVFLMRELSDSIKFHDNGSTVEMRFKI